jgi:hypothetical protein
MAKTKKKAKSFLPKRIAGVKVPKSVRKGRLGEMLASRTGQALIAEAIMATGAVAVAKKASDSPKARGFIHNAAERVRNAGDEAGHDAGVAGGVLAYALGEAARSFADALKRGGDDAGLRTGGEMAWTPDYGAPEPRTDAKKKPASSREAAPL